MCPSSGTHPSTTSAAAELFSTSERRSNVRRRWSRAVAAASLAIQAGANINSLQNMIGHESAGLTLDRYGHLQSVGC
jgi:site-specific recombinase XerD